MSLRNRLKNPRLLVSLILIILVLIISIIYLESIKEFLTLLLSYQRKDWVVPVVVSVILFILYLILWIWQIQKRHIFPLIRKRWIVPFVPILFGITTIIIHQLPSDNNGVGNDLTFLFGAVSIISLTLSLVVLITLRETLNDELQQMEAAIDLIQSARKKLVILVLTPNIGFARAAYLAEWKLCDRLCKALTDKLKELMALGASGKNVVIKIGILGNTDLQNFLSSKATGLQNNPGEMSGQHNAGESYLYRTNLLLEGLREMITLAQTNNLPPEKFTFIEWKDNCIVLNSFGDPPEEFPPLGILIADNHTAIIQYNTYLLSPSPVEVRGEILRSPEEIEAFSLLVNSYIKEYKQ